MLFGVFFDVKNPKKVGRALRSEANFDTRTDPGREKHSSECGPTARGM
jgi:hypothetical protein